TSDARSTTTFPSAFLTRTSRSVFATISPSTLRPSLRNTVAASAVDVPPTAARRATTTKRHHGGTEDTGGTRRRARGRVRVCRSPTLRSSSAVLRALRASVVSFPTAASSLVRQLDPVFLQFTLQSEARDAQELRGARLVVLGEDERLADLVDLHGLDEHV